VCLVIEIGATKIATGMCWLWRGLVQREPIPERSRISLRFAWIRFREATTRSWNASHSQETNHLDLRFIED
jgi:hypothetical protein